VSPTLALISLRSSAASSSLATLERLRQQDVLVLRSDEAGEITIVPTKNGYRTYRYLAEETN
ncbi:MAG TPA: hypothetical protein PK537_03435, partial [Candidatus Limiplasma sp.]|nr:hypothetical protein [Candidatus Limiplasma sp.]